MLVCIIALLALATAARAEGPLDQTYFDNPSNATTTILPPNPTNATCQVLIGLTLTGSNSSSDTRAPTASQVPTTVYGNLTFQVSNQGNDSIQNSFTLSVDVLPSVLFQTAVGASIGTVAQSTRNVSLATTPLKSYQTLGADGVDSVFINTTVIANSQDFLPRAIAFQHSDFPETLCELALAGSPPGNVLPTFDLAPPSGR